MPRHDFDPTAVTTTLEILPKGDYLFSVGEPKAFERISQTKGTPNWGIRWSLKVEDVVQGDPNAKGKRVVYTGYLHTEDAAGFPKQFLMACLGFEINNKNERAFNQQFQGQDWSYDTDSGAVGDVWRQSTGKTVIGSVDVAPNINDPGAFIQQFRGWRPASSL